MAGFFLNRRTLLAGGAAAFGGRLVWAVVACSGEDLSTDAVYAWRV